MPNPLEAAIEQMAHTLNATDEPTFGLVLDALYQTKFTGAVTIHCHQGHPQLLEIGRPVRIDLTRKPPLK